jgi:D-arabinose 1-dehydrogenase-like Zn-dependent alcohol dehydrogenase
VTAAMPTNVRFQQIAWSPLPDNVSFLEGAAATDAGMTSYHALYKAGGAKPGMKVGIIGIGGLGQFAAGMALIDGCEVYAADISPEARKLAEEMGIKEVYENAIDLAPAKCDVIVDYAGFGQTTTEALEAVNDFGKVVVVGMGILEAKINTRSLILKQAQVVGSCGGTAEDIKDVYDLSSDRITEHNKALPAVPRGLYRLSFLLRFFALFLCADWPDPFLRGCLSKKIYLICRL